MDPVKPPGDLGYDNNSIQTNFGPGTQDEEDTNMADTENWEENEQDYSQFSLFEEQNAKDESTERNTNDKEMAKEETPKKTLSIPKHRDEDTVMNDDIGSNEKGLYNDDEGDTKEDMPVEFKTWRDHRSSKQNKMVDIYPVPKLCNKNKEPQLWNKNNETLTRHPTKNQPKMNKKQTNLTQNQIPNKHLKARNNDKTDVTKNDTPSARTRGKTVNSNKPSELQTEATNLKLWSHHYKINNNNNDIEATKDIQKDTNDILKNKNKNYHATTPMKNNSTEQINETSKVQAIIPAKGITMKQIQTDTVMIPVDNTRFVYGNIPSSSSSNTSSAAASSGRSRNPNNLTANTTPVEVIEIVDTSSGVTSSGSESFDSPIQNTRDSTADPG